MLVRGDLFAERFEITAGDDVALAVGDHSWRSQHVGCRVTGRRILRRRGGRVFGDELSGRIDKDGRVLKRSVGVVGPFSYPLALAVVVIFADELSGPKKQ